MALPTITLPDFSGIMRTIFTMNAGRQADADSSSVALSTENVAQLTAITAAQGAPADAAATTDTGTFSLIALFKRALGYLATIATNASSTAASPVQPRYPDYETVAASATDQIMGASGAAGDYLSHLIITPSTTSPGNVIIKDGSTVIFTFTGGASSVTTLIPFAVPLGLTAVTSWKITTGANVSAVAVGDFT